MTDDTQPTTNEEMQRFFDDYARTANDLDAERLAGFYADTALGAAPGFAASITGVEELRAASEQVVEFYRTIGRSDVRIESLDAHELGRDHALVTVGWSTTFPQAGPDRIPFEVSYLVQRGDGWKIIAFVSHEDERTLLQERGLLPQA